MTGRGVERKGCLVWSFAPTAVTIAAPQHVEAVEDRRERDESLIWDGRKSKGQNSSRRPHSMSRIDPALHVVVKVEPSSVRGEHGGTMYATGVEEIRNTTIPEY
ncbi:hypothetical protein CSPX01_00487 [Colletotrichum filicis]|nr:hypothetical protein CSPX01_00487 [Colletotrichum filicis]